MPLSIKNKKTSPERFVSLKAKLRFGTLSRTAVFCLLIGISTIIGLLAFQPADAQTWFEPPFAVPTLPSSPNTDAPIYGGNETAYGGATQSRTGQLIFRASGSSSFTCDSSVELCVEGSTLTEDILKVGSGVFPTTAKIVALGGQNHGVYGFSSSPSGAGVYGRTAVDDGRGVIGDAGAFEASIGVFGTAQGAGSIAIAGVSATGYAGYMEGSVYLSSLSDPLVIGSLTVSGDAILRSNLAVTTLVGTGQLATQTLSMRGVPFTTDTVNAKSIHDSLFIDTNLPGIQTFTLKSSDVGAACTGCTADGTILSGATVTWNVGPSSGDVAKRLLDNTTVVIGYTAQYLEEDTGVYREYFDFVPTTQTDLTYQECTGIPFTSQNTFTLVNTTGVDARFRLLAWYKDYSTVSSCYGFSHVRPITVTEAVDERDSIQIALTGATAADIFANSQADADDVRIFYNGTEIDRDVVAFTSSNVEIWFRSHITTTGPDPDNYLLLYGNPTSANPPNNKDNVYYFFDNFDDNSLDTSKWNTHTIDVSSSVTETGGKLSLNHNPQSYLQYTGASAYTNPVNYLFPKTGYYSFQYDLTALMNDDMFGSGIGNLGNDGVFIRNEIVNRDPTYYGGPAEKAIWFGMIKACGTTSTGGWIRTRGAGSASWNCLFGTNSSHTYTQSPAYTNGSTYSYLLTLESGTGVVTYQQAPGNRRIPVVYPTAVNATDYATIAGSFVVELHDGYGDGNNNGISAPGGSERYDNFLIRRGANSLNPPATVGAEL